MKSGIGCVIGDGCAHGLSGKACAVIGKDSGKSINSLGGRETWQKQGGLHVHGAENFYIGAGDDDDMEGCRRQILRAQRGSRDRQRSRLPGVGGALRRHMGYGGRSVGAVLRASLMSASSCARARWAAGREAALGLAKSASRRSATGGANVQAAKDTHMGKGGKDSMDMVSGEASELHTVCMGPTSAMTLAGGRHVEEVARGAAGEFGRLRPRARGHGLHWSILV